MISFSLFCLIVRYLYKFYFLFWDFIYIFIHLLYTLATKSSAKVYKCTPQTKYMNITLKQKNLADGRIRLFIEYYKASSTNAQRRYHRIGKRKRRNKSRPIETGCVYPLETRGIIIIFLIFKVFMKGHFFSESALFFV